MSLGILAQAIPPRTSQLAWILGSLGSLSSLLTLASAAILFAGAYYLVATKCRPAVLAAYLVLLPLPVIISFCGQMNGMIASLTVIAAAPDLEITRADFAGGFAVTLLNVLVALIASAPTYFLLAIGLLIRTMRPPHNTGEKVTQPVTYPSAPHQSLLGTTGTAPAVS